MMGYLWRSLVRYLFIDYVRGVLGHRPRRGRRGGECQEDDRQNN